MRSAAFAVCAIALACVCADRVVAQAPLTNADVVRFVGLGMSEDVVTNLIAEAKQKDLARFDLSEAAVAELAAHGVTPSVIALMRAPIAIPAPVQLSQPVVPQQQKNQVAPTLPRSAPNVDVELPPDPAGAGKWVITSSINPLNDKKIVTAMLRAEAPIKGWLATATPTLVVRCQTPLRAESLPAFLPVQPGLEVYVVTDMPAQVENAEGLHQMQLRFDDQPAREWGGRESTDKKALFFAPVYATQIVVTDRMLLTSKQLLVGFTPFNASPVVIRFDVRGFRTHAKTLLAACPAVDRSAWKPMPR